MIVVNNPAIGERVRDRYRVDEIREIVDFLESNGALDFKPLPTGLYPAAGMDAAAAAHSGYGNVWIRDNVYVALALDAAGRDAAAAAVLSGLAAYQIKYRARFEDIVAGRVSAASPMNRPRVRFDGLTLDELPARWAHAQNDALGYFLWAYCRMAGAGRVAADGELLALIALYFERIRYWEDEDSGHWEERRKLEASSVGAVVAGLRALRDLLSARPDLARGFEGRIVTPEWLEAPIASGETALAAILPAECADADPLKARRYDAALLFLVYPLDVVDDAMARRIVEDVATRLGGDHGVRRYLGDSYWGADYKDKLPPGERTADFSERLAERDARVQPRPGEEAQWCIFDPIVSVIAGRRYLLGGDSADLDRQLRHFNRALGQITAPDCPRGALRCPEAYYLERGVWVPNDHVPLLWTQANLRLALSAMEASAARAGW